MRLLGVDVAIERGGRRLFAGLGLSVEAGEALVVVGPNGAGKSSLLRAIAGLLPLGAGRIALEGADPELGVGAQAHFAGHSDALKAALTARENLEFWAATLRPEAGAPRGPGPLGAAAALDRLGLAHVLDFRVGYLSAGQKRRVALARLLVAWRPLWLLDEPTGALDAAAQARFAEIMRGHLAAGGLIVAATHAPLGLEARQLRLGAAELAPA
jgi:heme exporter protein A